jgi:hypothetical protein
VPGLGRGGPVEVRGLILHDQSGSRDVAAIVARGVFMPTRKERSPSVWRRDTPCVGCVSASKGTPPQACIKACIT